MEQGVLKQLQYTMFLLSAMKKFGTGMLNLALLCIALTLLVNYQSFITSPQVNYLTTLPLIQLIGFFKTPLQLQTAANIFFNIFFSSPQNVQTKNRTYLNYKFYCFVIVL